MCEFFFILLVLVILEVIYFNDFFVGGEKYELKFVFFDFYRVSFELFVVSQGVVVQWEEQDWGFDQGLMFVVKFFGLFEFQIVQSLIGDYNIFFRYEDI